MKHLKQWNDIAAKLYAAQKKREECAAQEKKYKQILIHLSSNQTGIGDTFKFERIDRIGSIKYKNIPAIRNMTIAELDGYRGQPTCAWKLINMEEDEQHPFCEPAIRYQG